MAFELGDPRRVVEDRGGVVRRGGESIAAGDRLRVLVRQAETDRVGMGKSEAGKGQKRQPGKGNSDGMHEIGVLG
ncbi:hypothetical protein llg_01210 [Luteolibacter sp. LG18]|nr:hypothetical protein llg_01210 [Luteolibacter sp. LG18]